MKMSHRVFIGFIVIATIMFLIGLGMFAKVCTDAIATIP